MQTIMNVFGTFTKLDDSNRIKTQVQLQLQPSNLSEYWNRCSLTADFGANFMSFCYPDRINTKNTLSFILNELVENAIRFSDSSLKPITINLLHLNEQIIFEVSNIIDMDMSEKFIAFIQKYIIKENRNELYLELMKNQGNEEKSSKLGLMTLLNNFKSRIGFLFLMNEDKSITVTVQININPLEI